MAVNGILPLYHDAYCPLVPGYPLLRQHLLHLAPRLAGLPEEVKRELEDPNSRYNIGWSHGKEKLESGKLDLLKGSFYANPILDIPTTELSLVKRYPSYCGPNMWPRRALPELEPAFKALGKLILDVGLLLAHHCDRYGLTCGMFTRDAVELPCPDSAAGLYVKTRSGQIVKVVYGEDEIAYQIGETTEILSRGQLCATPHCVRAPKGEAAFGVERSTFALFMQLTGMLINQLFCILAVTGYLEKPVSILETLVNIHWVEDEKLIFPELKNIHEFSTPNGSISFGDYTEKVLDKYYDLEA
ncbi:UNVERIFIED_CONTAM: hypothetical protein Sangu_0687100 [Sesamum angustifolium]|uniref:Non-haem dioxygenase N-terminal domain-containing protein n=1 Tax=Sesamum angustifolium TaxID=2727405 RepID=A0AAW2PTB2_9LAMI